MRGCRHLLFYTRMPPSHNFVSGSTFSSSSRTTFYSVSLLFGNVRHSNGHCRLIPTIDSISAHCNCWTSIMLHPLSSCEPHRRSICPSQSPSERYGEEKTTCLHRESNPAQSVASHFTDNCGVEQSVALGYDVVWKFQDVSKSCNSSSIETNCSPSDVPSC